MRIISGKLGGRKLSPPDLPQLRPSSDRLRSGLFSMLGSLIEFSDLSVCDLYAGSGSLGIESLSRGVASCVFVEQNKKIAQALEQAIQTFGIKELARVVHGALPEKLEVLRGEQFDLIFADPPYDLDLASLLPLIPPLLSAEGLFVLESRSGEAPKVPESLTLFREREYGDSVVRVYKVQ